MESLKRQLKRGQPKGEAHSRAKLTKAQVVEIYTRAASGETYQKIATEFGVHQRSVENIVKGVTWTHLGLEPLPNRQGQYQRARKIQASDVNIIRRRIQNGESISGVARDYGVSRTTIANIWHGKTWTQVPNPPPSRRTRAWED